MISRKQRGQTGERLATEFLRQRGYDIVAANWHCRYGEIDLIARHGDTLVFIEVRARTGSDTGAAFESIGQRKQARIIAAVQAYLAAHALDDVHWRIDVVGVALRAGQPIIEHVENALDW